MRHFISGCMIAAFTLSASGGAASANHPGPVPKSTCWVSASPLTYGQLFAATGERQAKGASTTCKAT
jgi:hypothetical protein